MIVFARKMGAEVDGGRSLSRRDKVLVLALTIFSIWHLTAVVVWLAPRSYTRDRLIPITRAYTLLTKTAQGWGLFAPEPPSRDRALLVRMNFADGSTDELDWTHALVNQMRAVWPLRLGKELKAHHVLVNDREWKRYARAFAVFTCDLARREHGKSIDTVTFIRTTENFTLDRATFEMKRGAATKTVLGTYECPDIAVEPAR